MYDAYSFKSTEITSSKKTTLETKLNPIIVCSDNADLGRGNVALPISPDVLATWVCCLARQQTLPDVEGLL
jgi:hypothetical protein